MGKWMISSMQMSRRVHSGTISLCAALYSLLLFLPGAGTLHAQRSPAGSDRQVISSLGLLGSQVLKVRGWLPLARIN